MSTAAKMMKNLVEMFGHQSRAIRQNATRVLMMTQMPEGTPGEYILAELLIEFQATEGLFRQEYQVLAATGVSISKSKWWKKKKKQIGEKQVATLKCNQAA
ncbi:hypothetical protein OROHE_017254 [Orobanche hederae]